MARAILEKRQSSSRHESSVFCLATGLGIALPRYNIKLSTGALQGKAKYSMRISSVEFFWWLQQSEESEDSSALKVIQFQQIVTLCCLKERWEDFTVILGPYWENLLYYLYTTIPSIYDY